MLMESFLNSVTTTAADNACASELYSLQRLSECLFYNRPDQDFNPKRHVKFKFKPKNDLTYEIPIAVKSIELINNRSYDIRLEGIADRYDDDGYTCSFWYIDKNCDIVHDIVPGIGPDSKIRVFYNSVTGTSLIEPI